MSLQVKPLTLPLGLSSSSHAARLPTGHEQGTPDYLQPVGGPDQRPAEGSQLPPQSATSGQHTHTAELVLPLLAAAAVNLT